MNSTAISPVSSSVSHVLLVDDDSFMVELIGDMLADLGVVKVTTASDGKQATMAFEAAKATPDVVICDLNMPGKDGFQVMEMLAENKYRGGVILVTGMEERVMNSAALMGKFHQLHILGALKKPVSKKLLADTLAKMQGVGNKAR